MNDNAAMVSTLLETVKNLKEKLAAINTMAAA
jgi:hypothetical protein